MSVVYLLRHGQASFGAADYDVLSPLGERQAEVLGGELAARGVRPARACAGTLSRQRATASAALAAAGWELECEVDRRWNEYDHLGLVRHMVDPLPTDPREFQTALDRALLRWATDGESAGPAGSYADFGAGAVAALDELGGGLGPGGSAVVFTSGGVIAAICATLLGLDAAGLVALNRIVVNAAITKVVHGRSGTSLVSFNEHGHFEGPNRELLTYR